MTTMLPLEKTAIVEMLDAGFGRPELTKRVLDSLVIEKRRFSTGGVDEENCAGFYLDFADNELMRDVDNLPHHVAVHVQRDGLPTGADFLLFFSPKGAVKFFEATFYGYSLSIAEISSARHGFLFGG
jgi:hypothetical protein